ncbi:MAG: hypothetical protein ACR2OR_13660 [Hyphomicrobiales bacterium]
MVSMNKTGSHCVAIGEGRCQATAQLGKRVLHIAAAGFLMLIVADKKSLAGKCTTASYKSSDDGSLQLCAESDYIFAKGIIGEGSALKLAQTLLRYPKTKTIFLQSGGGLAAEGAQMGELVRKLGLQTAVNGMCASSCVLVYLGGVKRFKTRRAKLGFHRAAALADISDKERAELMSEMLPQLKAYFAEMGARPEALEPAWKRSIFNMYWYSTKELKKWNIATDYRGKTPAPPNQPTDIVQSTTVGSKMPCAMMGDFVKEWNKRNSKRWLDAATQSKWATVNCAESRVRFRYYLKAAKNRLSKKNQARSGHEVFCDDGFLREQMKYGWQIWFHVDFRDKKSRAIIVSCK